MSDITLKGFLLSRQWRDFPDGIELSFWAQSERGPLRLTVPGQSAVCFVDRDQPIGIPANAQRKQVNLKSTSGKPVDALYFQSQRDLSALDRSPEFGAILHESDLKPADRYLMERFINAGFIAQGSLSECNGYCEIKNPKLVPADQTPALTLASIDIETRGMSQQLYSIAMHSGETHVVLMVGDDENKSLDGFELQFFSTEKTLLEGFFTLLQKVDPDVIIGWNVIGFDLDFIARKCEQLGISLDLGRGGDACAILQVGSGASPVKFARVPGRAVLDGIDMLRAAFWSFESFSLENVGQELLGRGKTIQGTNKVEEINHLYETNKPELARYNIEDCRLVTEIFDKADLINFAMQRAQMTGLPIDKIGGAVQTFDNLYLPRLHRKGYVASTSESEGNGSPGGYVLDSKPGLYSNVIVLDFKSLYPSIIRTFLIDPLGLAIGYGQVADKKLTATSTTNNKLSDVDPVPGYEGAFFSRQEHILPELIEDLWSRRDEAKADKNAALSQAIKIIMNSLYGVLGSSSCRFHNHQLASSITRRGHEIIQQSQKFIEEAGWEVIYGDTDSLFVLLDQNSPSNQAIRVGEDLQASLNVYWRQLLANQFNLHSHLEVEFETLYVRFVMPTVRSAQGGAQRSIGRGTGMAFENTGSKKRYAGLMLNTDGSTRLVFKGLEAVRTDWTLMAREFQRELYTKVFNDEPVEELVRQTTSRLQAGELDEKLVYRKRLRRKLSDYQRNVPPHVQAARKSPNSQRWIDYVQTKAGPEPLDNITSVLDYEHYLEKQLIPVADGILHFLNTSYHAVISEQSELF